MFEARFRVEEQQRIDFVHLADESIFVQAHVVVFADVEMSFARKGALFLFALDVLLRLELGLFGESQPFGFFRRQGFELRQLLRIEFNLYTVGARLGFLLLFFLSK